MLLFKDEMYPKSPQNGGENILNSLKIINHSKLFAIILEIRPVKILVIFFFSLENGHIAFKSLSKLVR